ncbi:MAG: S-layer homology domain-containing protein [Candidatus Gracilibacteria bacterium]
MKKIFISFLGCFVFLSCIGVVWVANAFSDIDEDYLYIDAINYLADEGIISGYPDGTFRPFDTISRGELAKILTQKSLGDGPYPSNYQNCFPDVKDEWFAPYVCYAHSQGWFSGYDDGYFRPGNEVNRVEAIRMLITSQGLGDQVDDYDHEYIFDDVDNNAWYAPYLYVAKVNGLLTEDDYGYGVYYPGHLMERGEISENLYRTLTVEESVVTEELTGLCYNNECENEDPDYVIITRPLFINAIQDFVEWKQDNGFQVGVLTVDYINTRLNLGNPENNIQGTVKEFTNFHNAKYFLLVGDTETRADFNVYVTSDQDIQYNLQSANDLTKPWNVPSGYINLQFDDGSRSMMMSDLYYADFNGFHLKSNGIIDIQKGSDKFSFSTIVGRWPVRTNDELKTVIQKTMAMKPTNFIDSWMNNNFQEIHSQSDVEEICNNISPDFLAQGSVIPECAMYLIFGNSSHIGYAMDYVYYDAANNPIQDFRDYFLNTDQAVFAGFHGYMQGIENVSNADLINFQKIIPLYVSVSCGVVFYYLPGGDAFSEALIKAQKGPAVFAVPPNIYAFYKALDEGKTVGEAFYPKENTWMLDRWYTTLLGDPSLEVFDAD